MLGLCRKRFAQVQGWVAYGARWAAGVGRTCFGCLRDGCLAGPGRLGLASSHRAAMGGRELVSGATQIGGHAPRAPHIPRHPRRHYLSKKIPCIDCMHTEGPARGAHYYVGSKLPNLEKVLLLNTTTGDKKSLDPVFKNVD
eukprot:scaffold9622_cov113-Isochrysis_galbana.AAC.8